MLTARHVTCKKGNLLLLWLGTPAQNVTTGSHCRWKKLYAQLYIVYGHTWKQGKLNKVQYYCKPFQKYISTCPVAVPPQWKIFWPIHSRIGFARWNPVLLPPTRKDKVPFCEAITPGITIISINTFIHSSIIEWNSVCIIWNSRYVIVNSACKDYGFKILEIIFHLPPETGASRYVAPLSSALDATSFATSGLIVLLSISNEPSWTTLGKDDTV